MLFRYTKRLQQVFICLILEFLTSSTALLMNGTLSQNFYRKNMKIDEEDSNLLTNYTESKMPISILTDFLNLSFGNSTNTSMISEIQGITMSLFPSLNPSLNPSSLPSAIPTERPSTFPSMNPSFMPSSNPTPICHDLSSYKNPLTRMGCGSHRGTPCRKWIHLGLTKVQVLDLIRSCPEACQIDCE